MMLNLANYAQHGAPERTREAMQHMKAQGVRRVVRHTVIGTRSNWTIRDGGIWSRMHQAQTVISQVAEWRRGHAFQQSPSDCKRRARYPRRRVSLTASVLSSILLEREGHHQRRRVPKTSAPSSMT